MPPPQNLAALYKICLWLPFLEGFNEDRSLTEGTAEQM